MRADATSAAGTHRLAFLLAVLGLMMALVLPTTAAAQFKDDDRGGEDEATEEATEEAADDEEATEEADEDAEAADPEDLGLIDDGEYESPQFGYAVAWSRDWDLDTYYEEPLISDEEIAQDRLYLIWTGDNGAEAYVIVTGQETSRGGVDEDVAEWTDPDYIEEQPGWEDLEVEAILDDASSDTGAVLYSLVDTENDDAQYFQIYTAVELEDGSMIYVTFTVFEDYFEDAYIGAEDLLIEGEPVLNFLAWDDIEEAIADL